MMPHNKAKEIQYIYNVKYILKEAPFNYRANLIIIIIAAL